LQLTLLSRLLYLLPPTSILRQSTINPAVVNLSLNPPRRNSYGPAHHPTAHKVATTTTRISIATRLGRPFQINTFSGPSLLSSWYLGQGVNWTSFPHLGHLFWKRKITAKWLSRHILPQASYRLIIVPATLISDSQPTYFFERLAFLFFLTVGSKTLHNLPLRKHSQPGRPVPTEQSIIVGMRQLEYAPLCASPSSLAWA